MLLIEDHSNIPYSRRTFLNFFSRTLVAAGLAGYFRTDSIAAPERFHLTDAATHYKCIFNQRITDLDFLRKVSKNYVNSSGFGTFPAKNERTLELVIPDDTTKVQFDHAVSRIETKKDCTKLQIGVWLNGEALKPMNLNPLDYTDFKRYGSEAVLSPAGVRTVEEIAWNTYLAERVSRS